MPLISIVVPVYRAESCLQQLYERLIKSLETLTRDFEIILVEDCGEDESWSIIEQLALIDPRVRGMQFSRNFGQHAGITAGLDISRGQWVVVMDCDLQDLPEEIPRLYNKAQEGYDVVLAKRDKRLDSFFKGLCSKVFYKIFSYLTDIKYDSEIGNFRIISRNVVTNFCAMREQLRFFGGLINWMGFPTTTIDVVRSERYTGRSSYTFSKLWKLAIETIISNSDKPLRIAIHFGFFMAFLSFAYGLYILFKSIFYGSPIIGWSSIIVSIYFIGGVIISILGIIGIYLGKTFDETKKRPLYIFRKTTFDN